MRYAPRARTLLLAATALLAVTTAAGADTVLENGFFDSADLSAWQIVNGTLSRDTTVDADGFGLSGSALRSIGPTGSSASALLRQCVDVGAGPAWFAAAKVRFKPGETATGHAELRYEFFTAKGCVGTGIGSGSGSLVPAVVRGIWLDLAVGDFMSGVAPAGPGVKSIRVVIDLFKDGPGGPLTINVDDVTLATVGAPLCRGLAATIFGTDAPDVLKGTAGDDVIVGLGGKDRLYGRGGSDFLCGNDGKDTLIGGGGKDYLEGGEGGDVLKGGPDPDVLLGGSGNDRIFGGPGNDILDDGPGEDLCRPGADDAPEESFCDGAV